MSLRKTSMTGSIPYSSSSTSSNLIPRMMMMGSSSANTENSSSIIEQDQQPYSKEYMDAINIFREETMTKLYCLLQSERDYTSVPILPTESTDSANDITQKKSNDQQKQPQQLDDSSVSSSVGRGKKDDIINMKIKDVTVVNNTTKGHRGLDDGTTSLDAGGSSHSKNTVAKKLKPTTATNTGILKRKKQSDKSDLEQMEDIVKKCQNAYQIIKQEEEKRQALHPTPYFPISGGQSTAVGVTSSIASAVLPDGMLNSSSSGIPFQRQSMASIASSMAPPSISTIRSGRVIPTPASISSSTSSKRLLPPIDRENSDSSIQNTSNPILSISSSSSSSVPAVSNPNKKARKQLQYQSQTASSNSNNNNNTHSVRTSSPVSTLRGLQTTAIKGLPPVFSRSFSHSTTSTTISSNDANNNDDNMNSYTTTVGGDSSTSNRIVSDEDPITSMTPPPPPDALNFLAKLNKGAAANVATTTVSTSAATTVSTSTVASTAAATSTSTTKPSEAEEVATRMMKTRRQRRG